MTANDRLIEIYNRNIKDEQFYLQKIHENVKNP